MNKIQLQLIDIIARNLPMNSQVSRINSIVKGEDAILAGTTEIDGEKVDPEKDYIIGNHLYREINHKKRIKRAFQKHGKPGLIKYCQKYMRNPKKSEKLIEAINEAF